MNPNEIITEFIADARFRALLKSKTKDAPWEESRARIEALYNAMLPLDKTETRKTESKEERIRTIAEKIYFNFFKESDSDFEQLFSQLIVAEESDYCCQLINKYWDTLPEHLRDLISSGNLGIAMVEDADPYAALYTLGNNNYAIIINRGLQLILYSFFRIFSTRVKTTDGSGGFSISFEETISIMADYFYIFEKTRTISPRQNVELTKEQVSFASMLCVIAELFYIFHESSHIILEGFVEKESENQGNMEDCAKSEEYLADYFSMLSCFGVDSGLSTDLVYTGCECALLVFSMMDKLRLWKPYSSHPTFSERVNSLRTLLRDDVNDENNYNAIISTGRIIERMFNRIVDEIDSRPKEYVEFLNGKRKHIDEKIDDLLVKYWLGEVTKADNLPSPYWDSPGNIQKDQNPIVLIPDYSGFNSGMLTLLMNSGYHEYIHDQLSEHYDYNQSLLMSILNSDKKHPLDSLRTYFAYLKMIDNENVIDDFLKYFFEDKEYLKSDSGNPNGKRFTDYYEWRKTMINEEHPIREFIDYMDYMEPLNKIKLIIGFVNSLKEPLASVFRDLLK